MITISKLPEATQKVIRDIAADDEFKAAVAKIEARPATTQHHYGDYMGMISSLSGGNKNMAVMIALAIIEAGGHPVGVENGLKFGVGVGM
jgi:hypothetical protein